MENEQVAKKTDREIWRKGDGDGNGMSHYEPSIHVTQDEHIGINVGGMVFEKTVEEWHTLAVEDIKPNLGCATTFELIGELFARADIANTIGEEWPKYKTFVRE